MTSAQKGGPIENVFISVQLNQNILKLQSVGGAKEQKDRRTEIEKSLE